MWQLEQAKSESEMEASVFFVLPPVSRLCETGEDTKQAKRVYEQGVGAVITPNPATQTPVSKHTAKRV